MLTFITEIRYTVCMTSESCQWIAQQYFDSFVQKQCIGIGQCYNHERNLNSESMFIRMQDTSAVWIIFVFQMTVEWFFSSISYWSSTALLITFAPLVSHAFYTSSFTRSHTPYTYSLSDYYNDRLVDFSTDISPTDKPTSLRCISLRCIVLLERLHSFICCSLQRKYWRTWSSS